MSGYTPGQFDDADADRRLQEELRARQVAAATGALSRTAGFNDRAAFMSSLIAESAAAASSQAGTPLYARQAAAAAAAAHSPFGPYSALSSQQASPYAVGHMPTEAVAASLYARQRFAGYGGAAAAAAAAAHGYPYPPFGRPGQEMALIDRYNAQHQNAALLQHAAGGKSPPGLGAPYGGSPKLTSPSKPPRTPQSAATPQSNGSTPSTRLPKRSPPSTLSSSVAKKIEDGELKEDIEWFMGCVPLGLEDDKYWLSELQVYLRANFAEAFGATEEDIAAPMHGRNKPIALGQVGIRCMHCKNENPAERGQQATSYPSLISGIYNSVQQMLRLHLDCCQAMPPDIRAKIEALKLSSSSRGGRKQYWIDSAKRLGLVDTVHGIHFGRDPLGPLPPLAGPSVNSKEGRKKKEAQNKKNGAADEDANGGPFGPPIPQLDERPLVFPEDEPLISDYLYLTLEQMSPCVLMEADRVGCYKTRKVGFPGLACKHCVGQAGCGRYFPASEASLSQTTTSQTIMNHVRNCRRCPVEIRENLELMKRARMGPDGKRADKPKHGGRKVFFHRLWCRIQGIPIEESKGQTKEKKKRTKRGGSKSPSKKRKVANASDDEHDGNSDGENNRSGAMPKLTASSEETDFESSSDENVRGHKSSSKSKSKSTKKKKASTLYEGCVRLTKSDDTDWLSGLQCFARSDLVEAFTYKEKDDLEGYSGRKEPAVGQVGIRCAFCKTLAPAVRPSGCVAFPESLSSIHSKVGDMVRHHFHSCPAMPDDIKQTFKSLRGFNSKGDDSQQYWIDSARDVGLSNIAPGGKGAGWGITFKRDPLQPSPSDEIDREKVGASSPASGKVSLVREGDRDLCTDQIMLLMRQVKACTFQKRDRRGGPGARGRDRVLGFAGLCCKHCASSNNIGRYFPVSAKNLTDNTANSILSHISGCSRCPEPIKASLVFLSHRAIMQKAQLSGSWKKTYFKKIWDRLHVDRDWASSAAEEEDEEDDVSASSSEEETDEDTGKESNDSGDTGTESEEEPMGDAMAILIKTAAQWLTDQDHVDDSREYRSARGRTLPGSKRSTFSPREKSSLTSGKRRRVNF